MTEAEQRLAEVKQAISEILREGQRIRKADRELQRAELSALRQLESQYADQVAAETAAKTRGRNRISYLSI